MLVMRDFTVINDDANTILSELPDECVDTIVTSPPYFKHRWYGDRDVFGQEAKPEDYIEHTSQFAQECKRVLKRKGTMCWIVGDTYATGSGIGSHSGLTAARRGNKIFIDPNDPSMMSRGTSRRPKVKSDVWKMKSKGLVLIPFHVGCRFQQDDWIVRNVITWAKPDCMPIGRAKDRCNVTSETIFVLTKDEDAYFDQETLRSMMQEYAKLHPTHQEYAIGDVWTISPADWKGEHYAVFPNEIPRRCIGMACPPGGIVLDIFSGMATTGIEAVKLGRYYIGIELYQKYVDMSLRRYVDEIINKGIRSSVA